ncbi:MAG: glutathione S-transferase family protein [Pseudomonadota bacterium]
MSDSTDLDLYVFHRSYYCGKMLAYLNYKQIPHNRVYKSLAEQGDTILEQTGLRVMPVIQLPDGRWMNDTTPMMLWFEEQYPQHSVLPADPVSKFFVRLLEDYADEWMWRPAINSRWQNKVDRNYYQKLFPTEFIGAKGWVRRAQSAVINRHMHKTFLEGDGITDQNREHVWSIYTDTLKRLEAIFAVQPFLLGDKPCLADFGFFGSMFWHFGSDPTPSRIMHEQAPAVFEWVARLWNAKGETLSAGNFTVRPGTAPELWSELLTDVGQSYLPYLEANAAAFKQGAKRFDHSVAGYDYPGVQVSPYRVWCLEQLKKALLALTDEEQRAVHDVLAETGGWDALLSHQDIASNYDPEDLAPFTKPGKVSTASKWDFWLNGSNYITRKRAWSKP